MPNWSEILSEVQQQIVSGHSQAGNAYNLVRRHHLKELQKITQRNVVAYYSGWMSKPTVGGTSITDEDKNGFMLSMHKLDKSKGLDLILHTPGGSIASTQSIVDYQRRMFNNDIRAFVPQSAMSAGTMLACSCKEIWMGKHSNLGPIDPQVRGLPAYGVILEFKRACREVKRDPSKIQLWNTIISQYRPTFIGQCENAIEWTKSFVEQQLTDVMFCGERDANRKARKIVQKLSHYPTNRTHELHIHYDECLAMGLKVELFEKEGNEELQDKILTVHHCYMLTLMNTSAYKIIENHLGVSLVKQLTKNE